MKSGRLQREKKSESDGDGREQTRFAPGPSRPPLTFNHPDSPALRLDQGVGSSKTSLQHPIQAKLTVNEPGDQYEQEADRIAEEVMRMPGPAVRLQRKCGCSAASGQSCEGCGQGPSPLQRSATSAITSENRNDNHSVSEVLRAPGQPLDHSTRAFMEARFAHDFNHVRVHTGGRAAETARTVGARAYTVGRDIVFGAGKYSPTTSEGKRLLAHELTHVIQQTPDANTREAGSASSQPAESRHVSKGQGSDRVSSFRHLPFSFLQRDIDHTVIATDTLYSLAAQYGVTVGAIQAANNMGSTTTIRDGRVLIIPGRHRVLSTDTLYSLARRYSVTIGAIQAANSMGNSTTLRDGQILIIPTAVGLPNQPAPQQAPPNQPAPQQAPPNQPAQPAPTNQPTPQTPTNQPAQPTVTQQPAAAVTGHLPGQNYASGVVREQSFLRQANLQTVQTLNNHRIFFANGTTVTFVAVSATHPEWIQVTGPAFEATTPPTSIANAQGPVLQTGWIQRAWTNMTLGLYRDLPVTDRTQTFAGLQSGNLTRANVQNIVLHQTESPSQQSTLNAYQARMQQGGHVGAQYLIGETGEISLISPVDRRVEHVRPDLPSGANPTVTNSASIGIEHVGMHRSITPAPPRPGANASATQRQTWTTEMARVRTDIAALPLSPPMQARLAALTDSQLFQTMRDNRWNIDVDISGAQKRSTFLLTGRLRADFGLGLANIFAHEAVQQKTIGEGESIRDFLVAMENYPARVGALRALATARQDLQQNNAFIAVLQREESVVAAIRADATAAENTALANERATQPGPAIQREALRASFYQDFWARIAQLTALQQFLAGPSGTNMAQLNARLANWRR